MGRAYSGHGRGEMHAEILLENLRGNQLEGLCVGGSIILKRIFVK
jgi:predicted membrane GTPase involved in stress response